MTNPWAAFTDDRPNAVKRRVLRVASAALGFGTVANRSVPGHTLWRPLAVNFTITCSATVATRSPDLRYILEGNMQITFQNTIQLTAGQAATFNYVVGYPEVVVGSFLYTLPLPDIILEPGHQLQIFNSGGQSGDTLTNWDLWVEELFMEEDAPPPERVSVVDRLDSIEETIHRLR